MLTCGTLEVGCGLYTKNRAVCPPRKNVVKVYSYFEQVVRQMSPELMFKLRWS